VLVRLFSVVEFRPATAVELKLAAREDDKLASWPVVRLLRALDVSEAMALVERF
jgi:hypothetical protein